MQRTQISLTDEQQQALQRLAAVRRVSQAAVLRDALEQTLRDEQRSRHVAAARASIGAFNSGASGEIDYDGAFVESIA